MRTVAVVPIRGAHGAKTRLSPIFAEHERASLAWSMLTHVLDVLDACPGIDTTLIVTRESDETLRQIGPDPRHTVLFQPVEHTGLNAALDLGRDWALTHSYDAMLVLPADLPILAPADVESMVRPDAPAVIAPDRHGSGTNALFLRLDSAHPQQFAFAFGSQSYHRHHAEADRLGIQMKTARAPGLECDLDSPEDWRDLPIAIRQRLLDCVQRAESMAR
ncbi:MAG TPA: 2-phospho-L-lactate guanylyltransferase [Thermomicrobiales bacterium]|nr:2-phospho-L-lactate guanylyltransferase [Thermomicrobiales bacterium]